MTAAEVLVALWILGLIGVMGLAIALAFHEPGGGHGDIPEPDSPKWTEPSEVEERT